MRKIALLALVMAVLLVLTGCGPSKEVRETMAKIDAIAETEITLASKSAIDDAYNAYNALTEKEQGQVTNFASLEELKAQYNVVERNEGILKELNTKLSELPTMVVTKKQEIETAQKDITSLYESLDDAYKAKAKGYSNLDDSIKKCVSKSVKNLVSLNRKDLYPETASDLLRAYRDYLSETEIRDCLGDIGTAMCINDATSTLARLNRGKTYTITSVDAKCTNGEGMAKTPYQDGENQINGTMDVSLTNYFGVSFPSKVYISYSFNMSIENCYVGSVS